LSSAEVKRYAIFPNKPLALTIYLILGDLAMNEFRIDLRGVCSSHQPHSALIAAPLPAAHIPVT
jgi:hypothetical protein